MKEITTKPDKIIKFHTYWKDDKNHLHINKGYRVQYSNLNGFYKGGLRFHPSVSLELFKKLAYEQTLKNILTGLPMGGAKGGSDFDPKNKSDNEIKTFCYAFMKKLYKYIGEDIDVPAGDIGVGTKEIEYLYNAYKEYSGKSDCALTGKPISMGGCEGRKEATGYGLIYFAYKALETYYKDSFKGKRVIISGSGNVALYACKKAIELGATVIAMSDSSNSIYVPSGIDFEIVRRIKEDNKGRIKEYLNFDSKTQVFSSPKDIWKIKCDIALPCATQNEIDVSDASYLVNNKVIGVFEGSNLSTTKEASELLIQNKIIYSPGKASNAGGVTVSYFEIEQNKANLHFSFDEVDTKLKEVMENIFTNVYKTAKELGNIYDLKSGANEYAIRKYQSLLKK